MKMFIAFILLFNSFAFATLNDVDKTQVYEKNLLKNGGFENGKFLWTASAGSFAVTTSSPMIGQQHATWDAAASADTLTYTAQTIPAGMFGRTGSASCLITTASGTATHSLQVYDGTNIVATTTVLSNALPTRTTVNFSFPGSGSVSLRLYANANEPSIAIDDCYMGPAEGINFASVSQATFVGSAHIALQASCGSWTRTNTALGSFAADTDCTGPVVDINPGPGAIQTTDADLPKFTVNALPPGNYFVDINTPVMVEGSTSTACMAINDGTTTVGSVCTNHVAGQAAQSLHLSGYFQYTTTANHTFEVYGSQSTGQITLRNSTANEQVGFAITRFPLSTDMAYTQDNLSQVWTGYHDDTCSWARNSATLGDPTADATCALVERQNVNFGTVSTYTVTNPEPGIIFTPKRAGKYFVAAAVHYSSNAAMYVTFTLSDGTTIIGNCAQSFSGATQEGQCYLTGVYNATSTAPVTLRIQSAASGSTVTIAESTNGGGNTGVAVEWSIFTIDNNFPAPVLFTPRYARAHASSTSLSGSLATIVWTTEDEDNDNTMSTSVYTALDGGIYSVDCSLLIAATFAAGNANVLEVQKNSTVYSRSTVNAGGIQGSDKVHVHDSIRLVSGDTIRCQASSGGTSPSISSSNFDNYISIVKIGN